VLETFSAATFRPHVDEIFTIRLGDASIELRLARVTEPAMSAPRGVRENPFTLYFIGPTAPVLPQRIYTFEHDAFEPFSIFIVPIGLESGGVRYQAIFN